MLRSRYDHHAAVFFIRGIHGQPGTDQRIGIGGYVVRVLVKTLAFAARRLQEQHGLERQHVRTDQRFEHVQDTGLEQKPFMQRVLPVKHVYAQPVLSHLFGRQSRRRRIDPFDGNPTLHQCFGMAAYIFHFRSRHESADDEVAVAVVVDIVLDADPVSVRRHGALLRVERW